MKAGCNVSVPLALLLVLSSTAAFAQGCVHCPKESVLHSFSNINDGWLGCQPAPGLAMDAQGNLYGATVYGGYGPWEYISEYPDSVFGVGTVFELTQVAPGTWREQLLWTFVGDDDGANPAAGVTLDGQGNLYGTTSSGGANNQGTIYELTPAAGGNWSKQILYNFDGSDGSGPNSLLLFDAKGNLYGTTAGGGPHGLGTVFELSPETGGSWTLKTLHSFAGGDGDGQAPQQGVIFDASGNLYGTANQGGANSAGVVYKLLPAASGPWTEKILYNFGANANDGVLPAASLTFDGNGNLFGTTSGGGTYGNGTAFELVPTQGGTSTESVLYSFNADPPFTNAGYPTGGVVIDAVGNLYGTDSAGGEGFLGSSGAVFELTPGSGGTWTETLLNQFDPTVYDGSGPTGSMIVDDYGNLYGITIQGGGGAFADGYYENFGQGTVFKLAFTATVVPTPAISPAPGTYASAQTVTITDATPGVAIYYTTNGYEPNASSTPYTGPIKVSSSAQVKAIAYNAVQAQSQTATAMYEIP